MNDVSAGCREVFAKVLGVDPTLINDESSPDTLDQWDSLAHVEVMAQLEKSFSVEISPDQALEFETFKQVVDWLSERVDSKAAAG